MSMTTNPRERKSSDAVLAELTQALKEIPREAPKEIPREAPPLVRLDEEIFEREDAPGHSERQTLAAILGHRLSVLGRRLSFLGRLSWPGALPSWTCCWPAGSRVYRNRICFRVAVTRRPCRQTDDPAGC